MSESDDTPTSVRRRAKVPAADLTSPAPEPASPAPEPASPGPEVSAPPAAQRRTRTVRLPFVTAIIEIPNVPRVPVPHLGRRELAGAAGAVRSVLPAPEQALFYGGVAALAALELIDWPVAAVVAAGTYVAQRHHEPDHEWDRPALPARREAPPVAAPA